jgi:polysaccharide export outer membrane protein
MALSLAGCHTLGYYEPSMDRPVPPAAEPPRELSKMSLPPYRLEPPDIIQIQMLKSVPRNPYRLGYYDVLQIFVLGALPDQPIQGFFVVDGNGTINFGPVYGSVPVMGLTIDQARDAIFAHLAKTLAQPEVVVQLAQIADLQPVSGTYLVGPDGTINLMKYGTVRVAGMTLQEAKLAVERQLSYFFESPEVWIDMVSYNSKVYYIVTEGAHLGDNVIRVPITGNETVLDAISQIQGLSPLSSNQMWIARPAPGGFGCEQIMPIDWVAITKGGSTATNYQIMPGDRIFIAEDKMVALNNYMNKVVAPIERFFGFGSLVSSTIRSFKFIGSPNFGGF